MNLKKLLIAFAVTVGVISPAVAFEPLSIFSSHTKCWPSCVGKFCCDDYCGKPLPCAVAVKCFDCPDYCAKPLPCPPSGKMGFCCDDFCPKPFPPVCRVSAKNLSCIPNRLPPVDSHIPKQAAAFTTELLPADARVLEVEPVSSSRRVSNERQLDAN
jgi:hypothetical protein